MNKKLMYRCIGSIFLLIVMMFSSCQNDFNEVIGDENITDETLTSSLSRSGLNSGTSEVKMTMKEFREIISSSCTKEEWDFVMQLPDTLEISIYPNKNAGEFPKLDKKSIPVLKSMIDNQQRSHFGKENNTMKLLPPRIKSLSEAGGGDSGWFPGGGPGGNPDENDQIEYRSAQRDVTYFRWMVELEDSTYASSKVVATFNYVYNVTKRKLKSVDKPICSIVNITWGQIDKYILIWEDSGSKAEAANWGTKIIYTINGTVKCGVEIGSWAAGFVVEYVHGVTGEISVS